MKVPCHYCPKQTEPTIEDATVTICRDCALTEIVQTQSGNA